MATELVERLTLAIDKLERLYSGVEWRFSPHVDFPSEPGYSIYLAPSDGSPYGSGGDVAWVTSKRDMELIATLYATVQAQVDLLRAGIKNEEYRRSSRLWSFSLETSASDLADAILGRTW